MAKIYGLFGAMTGKLADSVMSVRNGEQIVRKYQPIVSNPSTPAQVASRARMKLLSQLSAVMAPVIAIPRNGTVSTRNLFVKKNYKLSSYQGNNADIAIEGVQLTDSVVSLPDVNVTRQAATMNASLNQAPAGLTSVVYCVFLRTANNELRYVTSVNQTVAGEAGVYSTDIDVRQSIPNNLPVLVLAYGIRANSDAARTMFSDMALVDGQGVARVVTTRTLAASDFTLTETKGVLVPAMRSK